MSGPQILSIIHYIGWGFIFLWIMATGFNQGMWNNALLFCNWVMAGFLAVPVSLVTIGLIVSSMDVGPDDVYLVVSIAAGIYWLLYLIAFFIMQTITESLSQVKVTFHPVVETLGSLFFSFGVFVNIAGATVPLLQFVGWHAR